MRRVAVPCVCGNNTLLLLSRHGRYQRRCTRLSVRHSICENRCQHGDDDITGDLYIHRVQAGEEHDEKYDAVRALLAMTTGNEEWRSLAKNECLLVGDMRDKEDEGRRKVCGALVYIRVDALELQVLQLAVCPSARRRGIGRALVKRAVAEAGEDANVLLEVADSNQAAKALYFREGFIVQGRRRAYYRDGADALLMTKLPS